MLLFRVPTFEDSKEIGCFSVTKPKVLILQYTSQIAIPQLLPFFISCGKLRTIYSAIPNLLTKLVLGLCYVNESCSTIPSTNSDAVSFNLPKFTSNAICHGATDLSVINTNFSKLTLGVVIKYTKLSRQVRKNLRGKQRYKAYLTLPQDIKVRGCVFRLYKLYALASSDTRNYESYADINFFLSELYFSGLDYEMLYLQIQKLMLQSYVENGGRAVVPTILPQ